MTKIKSARSRFALEAKQKSLKDKKSPFYGPPIREWDDEVLDAALASFKDLKADKEVENVIASSC